jgi:hypothetical protein
MAWDFEHAVEVNASPASAWAYWTNVENWTLDPAVEWVRLNGPFQAGARGQTKTRGGELVSWQVLDVQEGHSATIEISGAHFRWRFEPVAGGGTRLTQRIILDGPGSPPEGFADGVRAGMAKLAAAIDQVG